jgi:AsmA protein
MRKLLVALAAVLALVIAAVIVIPFVVPVAAYRSGLIALVEHATGRNLRIAGSVKLSVLPKLAFEANDISLGNPPGARTPDMARVKQLRVQLQPWPLLRGRIVVTGLVLVQPEIALEVDKTGHPNWVFGPTAAPSSAPARAAARPAATGGGLGPSVLAFKEVRLIGGSIGYLDQRSGRSERLDGVSMTASRRGPGGALTAGGSTVWHGETMTLALGLDRPQALFNGTQSEVDIKLAAAPITLSFSGRVAGMPRARLAGAVDLESGSVRRLAAWVGWPIASNGGFGPLAIRGTFAMAGAKARLVDADLSLDAIRAKGSVSIDSAGARPLVTGRLAVGKLDVSPYLSPGASSPATAAPRRPAPLPGKQSGRGDAPTGASLLTLADVDLDLELGGIAYRRFEIGESAVGLHLKDDRLTADLRRMALYRGNGHGKVAVDGTGAVSNVGLDVALTSVEIEPLAQAAIASNRLTGIGSLDLAVTARGNSQRELVGTLSGRGRVSLVNGQISGVNLLALAESAAKIERDLVGTLDVAGALNLLARGQVKGVDPVALAEDAAKGVVGGNNATNFGTLTATCTIINGLARNDDLRLQSGIVPITGAGIVDLRTRAVNYRVTLQLPNSITVPVQVGGTWDNPIYRPDLAAMLAQTPANAIAILKSTRGNVGKNLEGAGQGALGTLRSLFGK